MSLQHNIEPCETKREGRESPIQEGILVPLELGALRLLKQNLQEDGRIEVEVIATTDRARCPHCQRVCFTRFFWRLETFRLTHQLFISTHAARAQRRGTRKLRTYQSGISEEHMLRG